MTLCGRAGAGLAWALCLLLATAGRSAAQAPASVPEDEVELFKLHQGIGTQGQAGKDGRRGNARPQIYESEQGTGGLHTVGNVWMHVDNTNYGPGNVWYPLGLNQDPAAQWPGNSGIEYLYWSNLWVAGKGSDGIRRASEYDEIRGELADFAHTRHAYEGIPGGRRGFDDDGDRKVDEDFLNGKDDDGDGAIDEDFGAISPDMFATEMLDYTPEAINDVYSEPHIPLGLKIQRTTFEWSTPGGNDFVGIHYDIINGTDTPEYGRATGGQAHNIDSVYVGMYWRESTGDRTNPTGNSDDLVGHMEIGLDGDVQPSDILDNPSRSSHEDSILHIFWGADNDGDENTVAGAGAFVMLNATRFPRLGFKDNVSGDDIRNDNYGNAPRHLAVHAYRFLRAGLPYEQGGRPTTDLQIYDAMSDPLKSDENFPGLSQTGIYRQLFSVGPYVTLPVDSTIELDCAFAVGKANYSPDAKFPTRLSAFDDFNTKFGNKVSGGLLTSIQEAWLACRGVFQADLGAVSTHPCGDPNDPENPGDAGRETCILLPVGKKGFYRDCRDRGGVLRELNSDHCVWFDMDCDSTTGVCDDAGAPLVGLERWVGQSPPVPPTTTTVLGDRRIEIKWNDLSEHIPDPGTGDYDFEGYRLYKAEGWKRDPTTGLNGPANQLWQLVRDWSKPELNGAPPVNDVLAGARDPQVGEADYDPAQSCPPVVGSDGSVTPCHVHKVGYYHYVDTHVLNGFRYFYVVTAYDRTTKALQLQTSRLDTTESQETGRAATEDNVAIARTDCSPDNSHVKVVPNPYRYRADWDLRPSSTDPTGTHLAFNHLPCGKYKLGIFTAAGDLVRTFTDADAKGAGTIEWDLVSRNGQDIKAGIYLYSIESDFGRTVGRFTVIR